MFIDDFIKETNKKIIPKIKEALGRSADSKTRELLYYQIEVGGKRLRPVLAIASCLACGGKIKDVLYPAAGLEIIHNYTLIVDDIIDNSKIRRGKPTTWAKFGKSIAQCLGVDYSAAIFQAADRSKKPKEISALFSETIKKTVEGEILDILFEQAGRKDEKYIADNRFRKITEKDYLKMVGRKTSALIQAACRAGAVAAKAGKKETAALDKYGYNLGIAFQIKDDILDIFGHKKEFGKKIGNDICERKLGNIVIFYALKELPFSKRKKITAILRKREVKSKDVAGGIKLIKKTNAREKAHLLGEKYVRRAKKSLEEMGKNKWTKVLGDIADYVMERNK